MSFFNIATQEKLFNEYLTPGVEKEIAAVSKLWANIRKDWKKTDSQGKYARQRVMTAAAQSTRAGSTAAYPTPQQSTPNEIILKIKRAQMFSLAFDGLALEAARAKGAEVPPIEFEKDGIIMAMADDLSRQLMLDGSGRLCRLNGGVDAATTCTVDSAFYADATKFLKPGRVLEFDPGDGTDTKKLDSAGNPLAVSSITSSVEFELAVAPAVIGGDDLPDDYYLYNDIIITTDNDLAGVGEMMGIDGIARDTDPPHPHDLGLQGLAVATNPTWKGVHYALGGVDITEDMFLKILNVITPYAMPDVALCSEGVYREYYKLLSSYKSLPNVKKLWGGFTGRVFDYNGKEIPVVSDKFVPDGSIYFNPNSKLTLHTITPGIITWERVGGEILQKIAGMNQYAAEGHIFANLGVSLRRAFGKLSGINEPA